MGLSNNHSSTGVGKFVNFKKGKLAGYVDGETKLFSEITGRIVNLDIEDAEYDEKPYKKIVLYIADMDNEFQLGFPLVSGYGSSFCKICPNIDWAKDVEISGSFEQLSPTKNKTSLFIKQDDKNLKHFWTKGKPGKLPQPKESSDRNGKFLDFTKTNEYFLKMLIDKVRPAILKANPEGERVKNSVKESKGNDATEPMDDLPF